MRCREVVDELKPLYGARLSCRGRGACEPAASERIVRGTLGDIEAQLAAEPIERTALILVGRALAAEDFRESSLYDPDYQPPLQGARR